MKKIATIAGLIASLALPLFAVIALAAPPARAQGSRKDDIVFGTAGHPVAGATVTVCQATATGTPCAPLATVYTDATLAVTSSNPFHTDGMGNYHFYAPAGRYVVQITGPGISGTQTYRDVILAPDVSSSGSGNNISAFGLTLGGNLSVAGNATVNGSLSAGTFSPSSLRVPGNVSVGGPRPHIDVTAPPYNAKGDNATDDTAALTAAINAACAATGMGGSIPDVFLPPGQYKITQTQTPSAAPDLPWCSGLHLMGGGKPNAAFAYQISPASAIVVSPGASPNDAPVFQLTYPDFVSVFENVEIIGYNQAVNLQGASGTTFKNVCLKTPGTGHTDNTPLVVMNEIVLEYLGGCLENGYGHGLTASVMIAGGNTGVGNASQSYEVEMKNVQLSGGPIRYQQRGVNGSMFMWYLENVTREAASGDYIYVDSPANVVSVADSTFKNVWDFDTTGGASQSFINCATNCVSVSGVNIHHSNGGGWGGPAINLSTASGITAFNNQITGCQTYCSDRVIDSSGTPMFGVVQSNLSGFNFTSGGNSAAYIGSLDSWSGYNSGVGYIYTGRIGPPIMMTPADTYFSSVGVEATQGFLFNGNNQFGYSASLKPGNAPGTIDLNFASTFPPTGVTGTATTGGSLAANTYYYYVASTKAANCSDGVSRSAPSLSSTGVVVNGSPNNAVNVSWTLPAVASPGTIAGYCVVRSTDANGWTQKDNYATYYVSGASTTSFSDTGAAASSYGFMANFMAYTAVHRFTPYALGINTLNPQYDLDVTHTNAANSGIRATGANLTGLGASLSVCTDGSKNLTTSGCSSGATAGGSNTQVQYNNATALGGITNLTSNGTNPFLSAIAAPATPSTGLDVLYEDSTDLRFHDKNASGTIGTSVVADTGAANNFLTAISTAGVISKAQPAFSNLSGSAACGQLPALIGDVTTSAGSCMTALGNIPNATTMAGDVVTTNSAAPASPAAGKDALFTDSTDLRFHDKNASGTIGTTVVSDTGAANNFLTAISAAGAISKAQPAFSNLSGSIALGQTPLTTLGDLLSVNSTPALARIAGSTSATKQFLTQTGNGTVSALPVWGPIAPGDVPTLNQNTTGTAANLSGTPALPNGTTATTQTAGSNDTKLATDAYVDGHFIANGTFTLGTAAIASGACATVVTVAATGVATTDVVGVGFNGDPTAVTGYGASATGAVLSIYPYPTANNVNVKVCNSTSASITPGAMTLNWKVTR